MESRWLLSNKKGKFSDISKRYSISEVIARYLVNRGPSLEAITINL